VKIISLRISIERGETFEVQIKDLQATGGSNFSIEKLR
jgi:hypothetical protein